MTSSSIVPAIRGFAGEPEADGFRRGLRAAPDAQLAQDRRDVVSDGSLGQHQPSSHLGVSETLGHEPEHLELARREVRRICLRRRPQPTRHPTYAALTQPARDNGRRGPSS